MAWKQDLAKLKQQLGPETAQPPKARPKPAPRPEKTGSLDDEDAVFLSAMGLKPSERKSAPAADRPAPLASADPTPPPPPTPETFEAALLDLKGLRPLSKGFQGTPTPVPAKEAPALPVAVEPAPVVLPPPEAPVPEPEVPVAAAESAAVPTRFQLAAGMAIDVDGMLDLRGHTVPDAVERLKDRLGDGQVLGWRSIQVMLGPDPKLHEGLLELLASGQAPMVARYAQAPVPMGGTQAWLLYFVSQP
ncbi:Smr/MutS family protein [Geothrix sp. 21YS21S-4]|uniref:Smr/MutS family protein n=1 Tax=Geothrix sp. 21YS21S-4 TaxID=3068889 RepID=UPI0027BAFEFF|nr:Smr/MutS family protein [Geothrix sp. 21YS21S-4]